ncbi:MAG TPA: hypothetical protein VFY84_15705 [Jiangellales bacterium]|nr:hypothetical protein [Jiangellales bacterium]
MTRARSGALGGPDVRGLLRPAEDGNRRAKIDAVEVVDAIVPRLLDCGPDLIAVSSDHSTPSQLASQSWHVMPTLVWNGHERDELDRFGERWCRRGALGTHPAADMMPLLLAMAGRLGGFGA